MRIGPDRVALFIVRDFSSRKIEVRTASVSAPGILSDPVRSYQFDLRHATIFLDKNPADIDGDGTADHSDFSVLLHAWGENPGHPADLNGDGVVNVIDFLLLLKHWGEKSTWFLYYLNDTGTAIGVMTAPVIME